MAQIDELTSAALTAAASGDWVQAERGWREVLLQEPDHVQALYSLGVHAYRQSRLGQAQAWLLRAASAGPRDPMIPLALAVVHRAAGDADAEWGAITRGLALDPYSPHALLAKAEFLERSGRSNLAASVYRDVLKVVPEPWPDGLAARVAHARQRVAEDAVALFEHLQRSLEPMRGALSVVESRRWHDAISILSGRSRPYLPDCNQLYVPRLPAIPFFERDQFAWVPGLEARKEAIRAELSALIAGAPQEFSPYVAYRPGEPVNQWADLNHSRCWSAFHLWRHGQPVEENLARCPQSAAAMAAVDAADIGGLCPNAMFSALAPGTSIPPHHGETNARLVAHLPLVVPEGCSIRVGSEWRGWEEGRVLVFDDSIEHEARNDSSVLRVVMIFDVWNPLLSMAERAMVRATSDAMRIFRTLQEA